MTLRIHNTLTRRTEPFEPRRRGAVSMYVCGPTVYDVPHLGHGRTALTYDVIRRYLEWRGLDVTVASNVTDIDDKIIARARADGRAEPDVAAEFSAAYDVGMARLGVLEAHTRPRATQFVAQMVDVVAALLARGAAYEVPGRGVYLSVEAVDGYGRLAGRDVEQLRRDAGARVEVDPHKRSPLDFALWKAATAGEPSWETPWGPGRPGWHTECVAMSLDALGDGFDIHGGGDDLVFPHHQNELAQAVALGRAFARCWVHSAMVNVGGDKMAKSAGNYTNLSEALDDVGPRAVRMAALQTHYRKAMEMGPSSLKAAAAAVGRLDAFERRARAAGVELDDGEPDEEVMARFVEEMDDDFSTPAAVDLAFTVVRRVNAALDGAGGNADRAGGAAGDRAAAARAAEA
ncbi:MAG TPA: cysteine--tRNA ligase, partial [Acidimicrobiaceae bacterium]|nr:cysteine--tRNA ligase [Acidimicrobiaceae bacterium]